MITRILWLLGIFFVAWLIRRLLRVAAERRQVPPRTRQPSGPRFEGVMVRDRVCNTFLPRSRAIVHRDGEHEHFFCSESCRSAFLAQHNPV